MEKMGEVGLQECHGRSHFLCKVSVDSSPFNHQSILMKDHFMGTAKIEIEFCFLNNACL